MAIKTKDINFGEIDHFLYVRMHCVCFDLGLIVKEFIEHSYYFLVELIDEGGITHYEELHDKYLKYMTYRDMARYAPRRSKQKHSIVVTGIHEEIHEHLACIKEEMKWPWSNILRILLISMEAEIDMIDAEAWKDGAVKELVKEEFESRKTKRDALSNIKVLQLEDDTYSIDKTRKRLEYERKKGFYKEGKVEV